MMKSMPPWMGKPGADESAPMGKPPMKKAGKDMKRKPARKGFRKSDR